MATITSGPIVHLNRAPLVHVPCPASSSTQAGFHHSPRMASLAARRNNRRDVAVCALNDLRNDMDDNPEAIISGEWPENFSILCYQDVREFLEPQVHKELCPTTELSKVMSTLVPIVTQGQTLEEVDRYFQESSALPVVDDDYRCVGVYTKSDKDRAPDGLKSTVGEVMSSPAVTLSPEKTVMDAAILMLKKKVHKIPIVGDNGQVLGMVTRSDIYHMLELVEA